MRLVFQLSLALCLFSSSACAQSQSKPLPIIIDADTANEVDDLFALVRAIIAPELDIKGITSAQFHISPLASDTSALESHKINQDIIRLLERPDIPLLLGSNEWLKDAETPAPSEASQFIIDQAHKHSAIAPLHIAILGPCTNIASAILQDSTIVPKIYVHYLGFWHTPETNVYNKIEFNSGNDFFAVNLLLNNKDLRFDVMTATTSQHLVFDRSVMENHLKGKGGIADYLSDRWDTYERWFLKDDPKKLKWIMWDVAILQALIHPHLAEKETFDTPSENTKREIEIYTKIDVPAMEADYWKSLNEIIK